jgi:hypothetical protein
MIKKPQIRQDVLIGFDGNLIGENPPPAENVVKKLMCLKRTGPRLLINGFPKPISSLKLKNRPSLNPSKGL